MSEFPELKQHDWGNSQGDWLNNPSGRKICRICGCSEKTPEIQIGVKYVDTPTSRWWHYRDCLGKEFVSSIEISCPVFGANAEVKEMARRAKVLAQRAQNSTDTLEGRVLQLEEAPQGRAVQIDLTELAKALVALAKDAKALEQLKSALPPSVIEVIPVVSTSSEEESSSE